MSIREMGLTVCEIEELGGRGEHLGRQLLRLRLRRRASQNPRRDAPWAVQRGV